MLELEAFVTRVTFDPWAPQPVFIPGLNDPASPVLHSASRCCEEAGPQSSLGCISFWTLEKRLPSSWKIFQMATMGTQTTEEKVMHQPSTFAHAGKM